MTYNNGEQFAISEVSRDMVRLGPERLSVPVTCFVQLVQPHVGLSWNRTKARVSVILAGSARDENKIYEKGQHFSCNTSE